LAAGKFDFLNDFAGIPGTTGTMLEQMSLLLRPWNTAPSAEPPGTDFKSVLQPTGLLRPIVDGTGVTVGFVRQPRPWAPRWLRCLSQRTLEVYESPDGSLVFALWRGWGWPAGWHVVDADEHAVGTVRGRAILDRFGHFLAALEPAEAGGRGRFLALQGRELGEYALEREGTRVTFAPALEGNPFAKMMLLGAVLVRDV